jgi:hypothetical protein
MGYPFSMVMVNITFAAAYQGLNPSFYASNPAELMQQVSGSELAATGLLPASFSAHSWRLL